MNRLLTITALALLLLIAAACTPSDSNSGPLEISLGPLPTEPLMTAMPTVMPSPTPEPATPTPTPVPAAYLEARQVAGYWNELSAIYNRVTDAENTYLNGTADMQSFDEFFAKKDAYVQTADQFVRVLDKAMADIAALTPPDRARPYHNATYGYLTEYRAYISDLRQGVSSNNITVWNQGVARQRKVAELEQLRRSERRTLFEFIQANGQLSSFVYNRSDRSVTGLRFPADG